MSGRRPLLHFWCPDELADGVLEWNPDAEPGRYASGVGRNLLELAARMHRDGLVVEIGGQASRAPELVVVAAGTVRTHEQANVVRALHAIARASGRFVLVRGDALPQWRFPLEPTIEVMPRAGVVQRPYQRWVPPLPQRGLVRRRDVPFDGIRTVAVKCNPENLPPALRAPEFAHALADAGAELWLDVPSASFGSDQRWHDFERVDAVLCVRSDSVGADWVSAKPATRLVNAWAAGCIPIAAREPAFVELATDGVDVRFVDSLDEIPSLVSSLNAQPQLVHALAEGVRRRQAELEPRRVVVLWRELLEEAAGTHGSRRRAARAIEAAWLVRARAAGGREWRALRRRARRLRPRRAQPWTSR